MKQYLRPSGIECVGNITWGTHLCQFYESKQDLIDVLVPYFRAGLENNEFCIWITAEPLTKGQALEAVKEGIPEFDRYLQQGQIEIIPYDAWYLQDGVFDAQRVLDGWADKLNRAQERGFAGLRLSGNTSWLDKDSWNEFVDYEERIDQVIHSQPMIALCSYSLQRCQGSDVLDVLRNHRFALIRRRDGWDLVESSELKRAKQALLESEARFRRLAENAPDIIFRFELEPNHSISYVSPAVMSILGYDPSELYADFDLFLSSIYPEYRIIFQELIANPSMAKPVTICCQHKNGQMVWLELRVVPVNNSSGQLVATEGIARDVTERYWNEKRLQFAAEVSATLASSLDYETTTAQIARLAVPDLADCCIVDVVGENGPLQLLTLAHRNPEKEKWAREIRRNFSIDPGSSAVGPANVIQTGQPELYPDVTDSLLDSLATNENELKILKNAIRSAIVVPLQAHGRILGAMTLLTTESERIYGQSDLEMAMELANRAAVAMDNAHLFRDRERTEQKLRETSDYLEKLVNYANAPIIVWDPCFRITRFNQAFERLTGYSSREVLGKDLSMLFPESSRKESLEKIARTLAGEYWESVEIPILRRDGQTRVALWNSANIYAEDATTLLATIAQEQDITERKLAEKALRDSEERYRLLLDGARDYAILILDPQGRVESWSSGAQRVKGYREEEILGRHISCFYTQEDVEQGLPELELKLAAANGRYESQGWRVRKDGSRFWAEFVITSLHDGEGKLTGFSMVTKDVTEWKRSEEELRKLSRAVEQSPATVVITDTHGNIEYANPKFEETTGYTVEEALGKNPRILKSGHTSDEEYRQLWATIKAGGEWRGEFLNKKKSGDLYWESASISPIRSTDGTITHYLAVKEEITERKRADEEIQKLNADLTQRAKELDTINKELESFSYSVSHDLRAPLRGIDGFSQALLDEYGDRLDDKGQHYLKRVRAATQRMACLIDDMLTLSRVTRHELMRKEVDLSALAADAAADLMKAEPERCVEFVIEPNVIAFGDPRLLTAVLENLIGNAWKFTSKHPRARIQFGTIAQDGSTVYYVRDDGAGFDMAYSEKLFGTFQRLHSQSEFRGTGIGLATVQRIIHRHGGRVWAEGAPEQGATFYFTLEPAATTS
ncbi:MAG: PAS domain S-box protein [Chloroflexota bacterium]|jgi:PAS domain S-box-containing protein